MRDRMTQHLITREIGIDMGHRVTLHGSKCRNLHGHRYTVQVTCSGRLAIEGEEMGMVLDFGFLKELMLEHIDEPCDHGMCLWDQDPFVKDFLPQDYHVADLIWREYWSGEGNFGKLYLIPFVPTAENLARHWYHRLTAPVLERSEGRAMCHSVTVWETPNCSAQFPVT